MSFLLFQLESNYLRHFAIGGFDRVGSVADKTRQVLLVQKGLAIKESLKSIKNGTD